MNNKRKESEQIEGYRLLGVSSWLTPESYYYFFFFPSDERHGSNVKLHGTSLQSLIARVQTAASPLVQL